MYSMKVILRVYGMEGVIPQTTLIPRVPQRLSRRPNWDPPTTFPASECVPPTRKQKGGYSPAGGGSQFGRLEKKPSALSTLWVIQIQYMRKSFF